MIDVMYVIPGLGGTGGAERSLAAMVPFWKDSIRLHIVTMSDRSHLEADMAVAGVRITRLPGGFWRQLRGLRRLVKLEQPDVVHTTLFDADVAGRLATLFMKVPVTCSLVNLNYGPEQMAAPAIRPVKLRMAQIVDAVTARRVNRFHALTYHVADVMARRLWVRPGKIDVIPRGRDHEKLGENTPERRRQVRDSLGLGEEPVVLVAARHEYQKGIDIVVEAFPRVVAEHTKAVLLLAGGEGSETAKLKAMVIDLRLERNVRFIGPRDDVPDLMVAADVFCVPSRWEGFASIMAEAMGVGAQTLASDIPTLREVGGVPPWCRFVSSNTDSWVDALSNALGSGDFERSSELSQIAVRRFRSTYDARPVAERLDGFWKASIESSGIS